MPLSDLRAAARAHGGECLATTYKNIDEPVRWRCAQGHVWMARPHSVLRTGSWCPGCRSNHPADLAVLHRIAQRRGGECLSKRLTGASSRLRWRCREGHEWTALANNVKKGSWCPRCAHWGTAWRRLDIDDMWNTAAERGGKCLSPAYDGPEEPLLWECANGHRWKARPGNVRHGSWCPTCAFRTRGTIDAMRALATERGGACLSSEYLNDKVVLKWRCAKRHRFEYPALAVKSGAWCPTCRPPPRLREIHVPDPVVVERAKKEVRVAQSKVSAAERAANMLARCREAAEGRGGACLADSYQGSTTKLTWRCASGHEWKTTPRLALDGYWCPDCASIARLGAIRARKFAAVRRIAKRRGGECLSTTYVNNVTKLRWRCSRGHEWEASASLIDAGYWCASCKRGAFVNERLQALRDIAEKRGGQCLSTEYVTAGAPLRWECGESHRWWSSANHVLAGTWCPRCLGMPRGELARLRRIARHRGGKCLSLEYAGSSTPLLWQCRKGHEWHAKPAGVVKGTWCPECGRHAPGPMLTLDEMKRTAEERGGECLATTYHNALTPMWWRCGRGHEWETRAADIRRGQWCPVCATTFPGTIDGMRAWARGLGGKCLSDEYDDPRVPLNWQCAKGHRFKALAKAVKSGVWCAKCSRKPTEPAPRRGSRIAWSAATAMRRAGKSVTVRKP